MTLEPLLRMHDANYVRLRLRNILYDIRFAHGRDTAQIPHSFDTDALLDFSREEMRRRHLRNVPQWTDLVEAAAAVEAVVGDPDQARKLLQVGARTTGHERAFNLYHQAVLLHMPAGERLAARRLLLDAHDSVTGDRDLKTRIVLASGRAARKLGDRPGAEKAYSQILATGVTKYRPLAMQYLALVKFDMGDLDDAISLNRKAHTIFKRERDEYAAIGADTDLLAITTMSDPARALAHGQALLKRHERLLDLSHVVGCTNNLGVAAMHAGDHRAAREYYVKAITYASALRRRALLAGAYMNLGRVLRAQRRAAASLAAFDRAASLYRASESNIEEFRTLAGALETVSSSGDATVIGVLLARLRELLQTGEAFPARSLAIVADVSTSYALGGSPVKSSRRSVTSFASREGFAELDRITGDVRADQYDSLLTDRIGEGIPGRTSPPARSLVSFLLMFQGDFLRCRNYAREFGLTQDRSKNHLLDLCRRNILELTGTKKGSKYALAFHRSNA